MELNETFESQINRSDYKILIVDDVVSNVLLLKILLTNEKFQVCTANCGNACIEQAKNEKPDLILLDVMMTPKSGFEWAKELKSDARTVGVPIIFCTAKTLEEDLLQGFAIGSDDYIFKPFRISEVKARVKAVLRRTRAESEESKTILPGPTSSNIIKYEGLVLDLDRKECYVDNKEVLFTRLEFEVLALLLSKPGQVFSRERILQVAWPSNTIVLDRTVDVHITRIRKKIGRYGDYLRAKFSYGYMFGR